ncbi:hypothetical protein CAC42_7680 [Sphaceloma murrayae]|uniref:Glycosyltransferase family 69 protein n=1 Tax=Sphaceloma murrayae TaxID=2082308 RepID=A0A2K1QXS8_9PEZI|nr:hypothetical protein CAC42_7680 [Sphaceloma murrayae]
MPAHLRLSTRRTRRLALRILLLGAFALLLDLVALSRAAVAPEAPASRDDAPTRHGAEERVFIATILWNSGRYMPTLNGSLLATIDALGRDKVHVSILESGSWDETKGALTGLEGELGRRGVSRRVRLVGETHEGTMRRVLGPWWSRRSDEFDLGNWERRGEGETWEEVPVEGQEGRTRKRVIEREELERRRREWDRAGGDREEDWIHTEGGREVRRIPYLARLRNMVMQDMVRVEEEGGEKFDKVLWVNDVKFRPDDVVALLDTNDNNYAAACALDFKKNHVFYDTFAMRDINGRPVTTQYWPYFLDPRSRGLLSAAQPVPVSACWNGMVAFDAAVFRNDNQRGVSGASFRGLSNDMAHLHLEASESCLIHADHPLFGRKGVYINPKVRVAYRDSVYDAMQKVGGDGVPLWVKARGTWALRWRKVFRDKKQKKLQKDIYRRVRDGFWKNKKDLHDVTHDQDDCEAQAGVPWKKLLSKEMGTQAYLISGFGDLPPAARLRNY